MVVLNCFADSVWKSDRSPGTTNDQALSTIGKALDQAQSRIDEYGTLSISTPVLVYGQSNQFSFNLTNGAYYYFTNAKSSIQGRRRHSISVPKR